MTDREMTPLEEIACRQRLAEVEAPAKRPEPQVLYEWSPNSSLRFRVVGYGKTAHRVEVMDGLLAPWRPLGRDEFGFSLQAQLLSLVEDRIRCSRCRERGE